MKPIRPLIGSAVNRLLAPFGYRLDHDVRMPSSVFESLARLGDRGFAPKCVADVGAARGDWTRAVLALFPRTASFWCFEPLGQNLQQLSELCKEDPRVRLWIGVLGDRIGTVSFHAHADQSSVLPSEWGGQQIPVRMATLDSLVISGGMACPELLKLDVQGAELLVLDGAYQCLPDVTVVQAEVSFRRVYSGAPLATEVILRLHSLGFRIFDVCDMHYRKQDRSLLQADFLFAREGPWFDPDRWGMV